MLPDLTKWKIYQNGVLRFTTEHIGIPSNISKGSLFYFNMPKRLAGFALGEQLQIVMPPGAPVYICSVTGQSEKPDDPQTVQIQAVIVSVDTSGIK